MRIKMLKTYGQLKPGHEYTVDNTTGKTLIAMDIALQAPSRRKRRRKK